ncbi:MAG: TraB/GumN family protein [Gammaproteobacteria bacterium]|nr:TraB/GumN family protein [Gammaproteobacteria bacterium]
MSIKRAALLCITAWLAAGSAVALPIWEITGTRNRVLLLGSIHTLRPSDYPLDPAIAAALDEADVVYMELDMDDMDPAASASTIAALARDPRGRQLPELLGSAAWTSAVEQGRKIGLDLSTLAPFEPWYAAIVITQLRLAQLGFDTARGVESHIVTSAGESGKEIRGLETLEGQLRTLDALSPGAQRTFLQLTLEEAASIGDEVDDMIAAWKSGDESILEHEMLDSVREQPEVYRSLILKRNEAFSRTIARLANDSQDYLVVVGTLHLVGDDSVLNMLARDGLKTRPVAEKAE